VLGLAVEPGTAGDHVAGSILRAQRHGLDVIVATPYDEDDDPLTFAKQLGATVVRDWVSSDDEPEESVTRSAKEEGYPGVIWKHEPSARLDFERSIDSFTDSTEYVVGGERAPAVDRSPTVLVAIPAYNEAATIWEVVTEAHPHADEVLVVDDGSEDDTARRAEEAGATVVEHGRNQGYGAALKRAFEEADRSGADHLVILDGDGQHDPADISKIVEAQQANDAEIVIGSRFTDDAETNAPLHRRFGLFLVNVLTNLSFGVVRPASWINDTQSGFRVYDRQAIQSLAAGDDVSDRMSASTDILHHAHHNGYEVVEAGTNVDYDVETGSSHHPVAHGITLVSNILKTVERDRPITTVGVPGFFGSIAGLGFGYWTFTNYIASGSFPLGLAITSAFFGLAGIFACFTAIILHSLNTQLGD